jgi:hypothetical protein
MYKHYNIYIALTQWSGRESSFVKLIFLYVTMLRQSVVSTGCLVESVSKIKAWSSSTTSNADVMKPWNSLQSAAPLKVSMLKHSLAVNLSEVQSKCTVTNTQTYLYVRSVNILVRSVTVCSTCFNSLLLCIEPKQCNVLVWISEWTATHLSNINQQIFHRRIAVSVPISCTKV